MSPETMELGILVGVWIELAIGAVGLYLTWRGLQERLRRKISRQVNEWLRSLGVRVAGRRE